MNKLHVLLRIFILLTPFIWPWWLVCICVCAAVFYFDSYYEIILLGLILDSIYATTYSQWGTYIFSLLCAGLYLGITQIKKKLIVY